MGASGDGTYGLPSDLAALIRPCYIPETAEVDFANGSGFGGTPYLPHGIDHPACPGCRNPMTLFVQLRLEELPGVEAAGRSGLLQLFYCTTDEPDLCEHSLRSWAPFSEGATVRIVPAYGGSASHVPPRFPARRITGWREEPDLPTTEELRGLGVVPAEDVAWRLVNADVPHVGDKLGGWPAWVKGVEYPNCPLCGSKMQMVFQLESEDHLPFRFGDGGTGHITRCKTHPSLVAFSWACG